MIRVPAGMVPQWGANSAAGHPRPMSGGAPARRLDFDIAPPTSAVSVVSEPAAPRPQAHRVVVEGPIWRGTSSGWRSTITAPVAHLFRRFEANDRDACSKDDRHVSAIALWWPDTAYGGDLLLVREHKNLRQYERAVVFTLGKFQGVKGPGLVLLIPLIQEMVRVDQRIQVVEIPTQDVISHDNVSMKVDAVLYFRVVDPERAVIQVQDYLPATNMLAQTTLRAVLGQHELDEMLSERKKLSTDVQSILDGQTETWGIKVSNVEIRTVELTENMVRAIAKQAEAERDRRAKIIHAEAEFQASQTLVNAATILSSIPAAMQLRYLQTLTEIGAEQNSTIIFPMPIDIIKPFLDLREKAGKPAGANGDGRVSPAKDVPLSA